MRPACYGVQARLLQGAFLTKSRLQTSPNTDSTLTRIPVPLRRMGGVASYFKGSGASESVEEPGVWLVVGLGNPGPRYEETRHNVGFMAVDALGRDANLRTDRLQANCRVGRGRLCGERVMVVKPMTFMNVSGEGVGKLSRHYKVPPERVLVIYDDLDTPVASVRVRGKGGHGGHNGMRSIIQHLGTNEFPRVKIGIGRPSEELPVVSYVLQDFTKAERELIDAALGTAVEAVRSVVALGTEKAVSGLRVAADGKPIPTKQPHQNGKGLKRPLGKQQGSKAAATGSTKAPPATTDTQPTTALGAALSAAQGKA